MGLSFRKNKYAGPLRFNLSKSGVGVSTGVKDSRVSFSSKGTYVNLGLNGIYYCKKIRGGKSARKKNKKQINTSVKQQINYSQTKAINEDAIRVADSAYSDSVLGQEIVKDIKRARVFFWLWIIASVVMICLFKEWGLFTTAVAAIPLWRFFFAHLDYELDSEAELEWKKLTEIIYEMRNSKKLWLVESASYNTNTKMNAGAHRSISRRDANVKLLKAKKGTGLRVKANVETALIKSKKCKILFIPSGILVKKRSKVFAYSYEQINFTASTINFVESGTVARDAEVIRRTWQYVNKNGTADRRYKDNKQLPVCLYGALKIRGNNIEIEIQTSNKTVTRNVDNAYQNYRDYIRKIVKTDEVSVSRVSRNTTNEMGQTSNEVSTGYGGDQFISYEERYLLEEINETIRELGRNGCIEFLEDQLGCKVRFVDGQMYQKHALLLYRASENVSDSLSTIEYIINANIPYKNEFEAVSDKEFLLHLFVDNLDGIAKELPLSNDLKQALEKAEAKKTAPKWYAPSDTGCGQNDFSDMLSSATDLFLDESPTSAEENDLYEDLFDIQEASENSIEKSGNNKDVVDDLMDFFEEE